MKKFSLYSVIATISVVLRQFVIPNPFASLGIFTSLLLNYLIETPLWLFTYSMVGIIYEACSCPALGSALYLLFYSLNVFLLSLICGSTFLWWAVMLGILYVVAIVTARIVKRIVCD